MATVLISRLLSPDDLKARLDQLEEQGGTIVQVVPTGDHYLVIYTPKGRPVRQARVETR